MNTYWDAQAHRYFTVNPQNGQRAYGPVVAPYPIHHQPVQQLPVTVTMPPRVNHALHATLTVMTCGLWIPVWFLVTLTAQQKVTVR